MTNLPPPGLGAYTGMTPNQVRYILLNADRIAKRRRDPAVTFTLEVFGTGMTVAYNLCRHAGFKPDLPIKEQRTC